MRIRPVRSQIWGGGWDLMRVSAAERWEVSHFLASGEARVTFWKNFLGLVRLVRRVGNDYKRGHRKRRSHSLISILTVFSAATTWYLSPLSVEVFPSVRAKSSNVFFSAQKGGTSARLECHQ
jgi:hypothetical protein